MNKKLDTQKKLFNRLICDLYPISDESISLLWNQMTLHRYPKNTFLVPVDTQKKVTYFILKGFAKAYTLEEGKENISRFIREGEFTSRSISRCIYEKSMVNVELLEDSLLLSIPFASLDNLFENNLELMKWSKRYYETQILGLEHFLSSVYFMKAEERYENLKEYAPKIVERVTLKVLASFLRITPESLSRIRKQGARRIKRSRKPNDLKGLGAI